jgi:hypothetical protein
MLMQIFGPSRVGPSKALAGDTGESHVDVELRAGAGMVCGWCRYRGELEDTIKPTVQIFADAMIPVWGVGSGHFELGPYLKGGLIDGAAVPQVAGGLAIGYRWGSWEVLGNAGLAYATERVGETTAGGLYYPGQTKHTYDLGASVRYDINGYFISLGYQHNSNGSGLGLNFFDGKGFNPGYDQVFLGVGTRF